MHHLGAVFAYRFGQGPQIDPSDQLLGRRWIAKIGLPPFGHPGTDERQLIDPAGRRYAVTLATAMRQVAATRWLSRATAMPIRTIGAMKMMPMMVVASSGATTRSIGLETGCRSRR